MKLVVGLGNPGKKYKATRHNVGFMVVDKILSDILSVSPHKVKKYHALVYYKQSSDLLFVKPQTMMNDSGKTMRVVVDQYKINMPNIWVIHDDLDLAFGAYKIQKGKGPKDHKGLLSIYESIGKNDFWHVRIGVDNRKLENRIDGEDYVLQNFEEDEMDSVDGVIGNVVEDLMDRVLD
ncbi:aminoacyl-tRNA hydrolase [Patescibacteria group bacterium]